MALTPSTMKLQLGSAAPDFSLPDPHGKVHRLADFANSPTLIIFACNHCPYVVHLQSALAQFAKDYASKGLKVVAINSNNVATHPADSPENMIPFAQKNGWDFPYLFDETQEVAKAYHAACTPDFFLFDAQHRLTYRGQFDDSRPGNNQPVTGESLRSAVDALLAGSAPIEPQKPSMGCNIKWK